MKPESRRAWPPFRRNTTTRGSTQRAKEAVAGAMVAAADVYAVTGAAADIEAEAGGTVKAVVVVVVEVAGRTQSTQLPPSQQGS